jgi:hypothetical protein
LVLQFSPNMTHEPNMEHVLALAAIIREVNGGQRLGAAALAKAILAHPASQWGPALPMPTDAELQADFRAWFKTRYDSDYFGGISLFDAIAWGKHLLQQSPQPAAPWPELPDSPPPGESGFRFGPSDTAWFAGRLQGWQLARAELERQREQAGAAPTPAPAPFPCISDDLVRSLIGDVLDESETATEAACMDRPYNPIPRIRARLTEILQLAAQNQAAERPAS